MSLWEEIYRAHFSSLADPAEGKEEDREKKALKQGQNCTPSLSPHHFFFFKKEILFCVPFVLFFPQFYPPSPFHSVNLPRGACDELN